LFDQLGVRPAAESLAGEYLRNALGCLEKAGAPQERKEELIALTGALTRRES